MTSRDLVNIVSGCVNAGLRRQDRLKVGHAGTLDPLATGVLVVGVGAAVRLMPYFGDLSKRYRATFRLGQSSDSGDLEGEIRSHPELPMPDLHAIEESARRCTGLITQVPPAHSAVWVDGVRAYKRQRSGQTFEMPSRQVRVDSIAVTRFEPPEFDADIVCGGGTYIRTLGMDIARLAGTVALMSSLRRVEVGPFRIEDSVSVSQIRQGPVIPMLMPTRLAVINLPQFDVSMEDSERLGNGVAVDGPQSEQSESTLGFSPELAAIGPDGHLRAIVYYRGGQWWPKRVFPITEDHPDTRRNNRE
jgi:tRNA pseudouridine55 synthase